MHGRPKLAEKARYNSLLKIKREENIFVGKMGCPRIQQYSLASPLKFSFEFCEA